MTASRWWNYVQRITGSATQQTIADKTGIAQSSIARWRTTSPRPETAVAFARSYSRPVLEALVEAEIVPEEDASLTEVPINLAEIDIDDLLAEIRRRVKN